MKATLEFDLEDRDDAERYRRANCADKMARLLYDLANNDNAMASITIDKETSRRINEACFDEGIIFSDIYT